MMRYIFYIPLVLLLLLPGCAARKDNTATLPSVPLPPQATMAEPSAVTPASSKQEGSFARKKEKDTVRTNAAPSKLSMTAAPEAGQSLALSTKPSASPRQGEPALLAELLEMKGAEAKENTAVSLMRPTALREAAQLVTFQTAMAYRYKQLLAATEQHNAILDTAFNFSPLLMTQGDALIMPPVLTRAGASMRIDDAKTATSAQTSYELLMPARYVSVVPNWREFLMADSFPLPEKPNPAVMPKNDKEREIWRNAVREAWEQGLGEADMLYADNVSRMVREYRGIMLYHLLTAQHLLSRVGTASAELGLKTANNGNTLNIGQKVYRITAPSAFMVSEAGIPAPEAKNTPRSKNKRK